MRRPAKAGRGAGDEAYCAPPMTPSNAAARGIAMRGLLGPILDGGGHSRLGGDVVPA
jgi:hypothetical protein